MTPAVAFDATLWDEPTTGIGLYARELSGALEGLGVPLRRVGARISGDAPRGGLSRSLFAVGRLPKLLAEGEEGLFHAVGNFNLPLTRPRPGLRLVLTVHDLIPQLFPDTVSTAFRWQFRLWLLRSVRLADRILCVSERTRADLLAAYPVDPAKVRVVHNGVDHVERAPALDEIGEAYLRTLGLPERFVLYAGSLDKRKNLDQVLDALELLAERRQPATLVVVGQSWFGSMPLERRMAELRAGGLDIRPLGFQPQAVLHALMRRTSAFVFPSRYEGFGLPPLEAMWLGAPTVVAAAGALPEVCGEGAWQVAVGDAPALADALSALLSTPELRARWSKAGQQQASRYTWRRAAEQTLTAYREVLEGG